MGQFSIKVNYFSKSITNIFFFNFGLSVFKEKVPIKYEKLNDNGKGQRLWKWVEVGTVMLPLVSYNDLDKLFKPTEL